MKKAFLFLGAVIGTVILITGIVEIGRGDSTGWLYVFVALLVIVLAIAPGWRLRELLTRQRTDD